MINQLEKDAFVKVTLETTRGLKMSSPMRCGGVRDSMIDDNGRRRCNVSTHLQTRHFFRAVLRLIVMYYCPKAVSSRTFTIYTYTGDLSDGMCMLLVHYYK